MNKTQKKELTKKRRFHQQVSKKCKDICHITMEPAVIENPITSVNMDVIHSLTLKELEYVLNEIVFSTRRLYKYKHPEVQAALKNELAERQLLLEKNH